MLIEYTVKFQKDGLTITQRIENGTATPAVKPEAAVEQDVLASTLEETREAKPAGPAPREQASVGGPSPRDETSGRSPRDQTSEPPNSSPAPITVFGPFINWSGPSAATNYPSEVSDAKQVSN